VVIRSTVEDSLGEVDLNKIARCVNSALRLLTSSYVRVNSDVGGWYHDFSQAPPGPVATAAVLLVFHKEGVRFPHAASCWRFLRSRQVGAPGQPEDGGFSLNTSLGQPTTFGAAAVLNLMGRSHSVLADRGPDARRALRWLEDNQNEDGGWGAFKNSPSRTTITCSALEALEVCDPCGAAYRRGVAWVLAAQHPEGGWGENSDCPPTLAHTSLALIRLAEAHTAERFSIASGYEWLVPRLDAVLQPDRADSFEWFNVSPRAGDSATTWRETIHHFQLPIVLRAVLRCPDKVPTGFLHVGLNQLIDSQSHTGDWPTSGPSLWAVLPSFQVFGEIRRISFGRVGGRLLLLPNVIALVGEGASGRSAWQILRPRRRPLAWARRHWAIFLVVAALLAAGLLAFTSIIKWTEAAIGLVLPVLLFVGQEILARRRN
jgi:hypothetical protein